MYGTHKNQHLLGLGQENDRISEVKAVCENSDVIIAVMGLDSGLEGEEGDMGNEFASGDKPDLKLPGLQLEILKTIKEFKKPTILVNLSGSAIALDWADENIEAIVQGWYPGAQGGRAIAELLFGDFSPEGKLPVTFYSEKNELPDFGDYNMKNRTYRYLESEPLYPFGYGLSYTDIEITDFAIVKKEIEENTSVKVKVIAKNKGSRYGRETIEVYIHCNQNEMPNYTLKALKKIALMPGESVEVELELTAEDFGLFNDDANLMLYKGTYDVFAGTSQPDERSKKLTGKEVWKDTILCKEDVILYHPNVYEK